MTGRIPRLLFSLCAAILLAAIPAESNAQDLLIVGANIVDPEAQTVTHASLLIRDGRVVEIGADIEAPNGVGTLDANGRWVVPGLFDLHTHSFGNFAVDGASGMLGTVGVAEVALRAGVTGFLDLFGMEDLILGQRNQQRAGELGGADIYASGPCLTATEGHCSEYGVPTRLVDSPDDARRQVGELAAKNPDVVKLVYDHQEYGGRTMPTVDRSTMEAVVAAAHDHGLKAVLHVGTWQDLTEAVEAGADAVTHTPGPDPVPAGLAALMVDRGTVHIPTLAVQSETGRIYEDQSLLDRPLLAEVVASDVIDGYRNPDEWPDQLKSFVEWGRPLRDANLEAVGALAAAGVLMATGTDAGNPGVFQGYSVHREMELLVEAGLSEWDALAAATAVPSTFLGAEWGVGLGDEATLVLLDASPLEAIANTQRIHAVVQRGVVVTQPQ